MNEFMDNVINGGYANSSQLKRWLKEHNKEEYTNQDIEDIYRAYDDWSMVDNGRTCIGEGCYAYRYDSEEDW